MTVSSSRCDCSNRQSTGSQHALCLASIGRRDVGQRRPHNRVSCSRSCDKIRPARPLTLTANGAIHPNQVIFRRFTPSTETIFDFLAGYRARLLTFLRFLVSSYFRNIPARLGSRQGLISGGGSVRTTSSRSMLMQRHPHITTIRLYPYVLGCVLDGFACGEPSLPGAFEANEAFISTPKRRGCSRKVLRP